MRPWFSYPSFLITGNKSRQIDIRLLPSLVPEGVKNVTIQMIEPELQTRIARLKELIDDGVVDAEKAGNGMSINCSNYTD